MSDIFQPGSCVLYYDDTLSKGIISKNNMELQFNPNYCTEYVDDMPIKMSEEQKRTLIQNKKLRQLRKPTIEEAVADYRNGCQDAFEYVYKYFEPKIRYMAKTKGNCVCTEDLFSEITLQLFQCVKKYKFGKIKFNTFFWRCAQNVVGMYYTRKNAQKRKNEFGEVSLNLQPSDNDHNELKDIIPDKNSENCFDDIQLECYLEKAIFPYLTDDRDKKIIKLLAQGYEITDMCNFVHLSKQCIYIRMKRIRKIISENISYEKFKMDLK